MRHTDSSSIKYRVLNIIVILIQALVIVLGAYGYTTVRSTQKQIIRSTQSSVALFSEHIKAQTDSVETFMVNLALTDDCFARLGSRENETQAYLDAYDISSDFNALLSGNNALTALLVLSPENEIRMARYGALYGATVEERAVTANALVRDLTESLLAGSPETQAWHSFRSEDRFYWIRVVRQQNAFLACAIDFGLLGSSARADYAFQGDLLFFDADGRQMNCFEESVPENVRWSAQGWGKFRGEGGNRLLITEELGKLTVAYLEPYAGVFGANNYFIFLMLFCLILCAAAMIFPYLYIKRTLFLPLDALIDTMERISAGELTARPSTRYESREFMQINETFNHMIEQITNLKIESYEKQLAVQKSEMTSLKLQIRPHFYLNCLKNVYALAETKQTAKIQQLILLLSTHLRYVFSFQTETVSLQQELELCRNYLNLCSVGQACGSSLRLNIDESLRDLPIPSISLLTFLENSVKYATNQSGELIITITAMRLELDDGAMASISIQDNGPGFSAEQLTTLNRLDGTQMPEVHVGIANVLRRFRLMYGDAFAVGFTNRRECGAKIDLFLPLANSSPSDTADETGGKL